MIFGVVVATEILARDSHPRFSGVGQREGVSRFGLVLAIVDRPDHLEILAGEYDRHAPVGRRGTELRILIGIIQVIGFTLQNDPDQWRMKILRQGRRDCQIRNSSNGRKA